MSKLKTLLHALMMELAGHALWALFTLPGIAGYISAAVWFSDMQKVWLVAISIVASILLTIGILAIVGSIILARRHKETASQKVTSKTQQMVEDKPSLGNLNFVFSSLEISKLAQDTRLDHKLTICATPENWNTFDVRIGDLKAKVQMPDQQLLEELSLSPVYGLVVSRLTKQMGQSLRWYCDITSEMAKRILACVNRVDNQISIELRLWLPDWQPSSFWPDMTRNSDPSRGLNCLIKVVDHSLILLGKEEIASRSKAFVKNLETEMVALEKVAQQEKPKSGAATEEFVKYYNSKLPDDILKWLKEIKGLINGYKSQKEA